MNGTDVLAPKRPASRRSTLAIFQALVVITMAGAVLWPLARMLQFAFADTGIDTAWGQLADVPELGKTLRNTAIVLVLSSALAVIVGSAFAWLNERTNARLGWLGSVLPLLPLLTPPVAGAIGWGFLLSERPGFINVGLRWVLGLLGIELEKGPLNIYSWWGLIFVYTLFLVPFAYLMVSAGLQSLDGSLEQASLVAGAGPGRTLARVTLPAVAPSIAAGGLLVVLTGVALFSVPVIIGTSAEINVLTVEIYRLLTFTYPPKIGAALMLSLILLGVISVMLLVQRRFNLRQRHAMPGGKASSPYVVSLGRWRWPARLIMLTYVAFSSVLPLGAMVLVSLQPFWSEHVPWSSLSMDNYQEVLFEHDFVGRAIRNSLVLGLGSALVGTFIAVCFAMFSSRHKGNVGRAADIVAKMPGAVSHIVVGVAMLIAFTGAPFRLSGSLLLLFLAYLILYLPQATTTAAAAFSQVSGELSEAAAVSGAKPGRVLRRVQVPLMRPHLLAGVGLLFVLAAGEITASALLSGTRNPVAGAVLLEYWQNGTFPELAAIAVVVTSVSAGVVLSILWATRRRQS